MIVDSQVINSILPYGLKGEIFHDAGDYFSYCLSTDNKRVVGNLSYKPDQCQVKYKMRVMAAPKKLPGFFKISSYKEFVKLGPALLMTQGQMAHIVERASSTFPELGEIRKKVLLENEPCSYNLIKENMMVKIKPETTREQRLLISNSIMAVNEEINMVIADTKGLREDMEANLAIVDFFSMCTSIICFVLGLF